MGQIRAVILLMTVMMLAGCSLGAGAGKPAAHSWPKNVQEIRVFYRDGTEARQAMAEAGEIKETMDQLRDVPDSYFGDPEQSGVLYRIQLVGETGTAEYVVNDLRETGALLPGKIYPASQKEGKFYIWSLSEALLQRLIGDPLLYLGQPPQLYVTLPGNGTSLEGMANRPLDRESVERAVAALITRPGEGHSVELTWLSDSTFRVQFPELRPHGALRLSLRGVMTAAGESFASQEQPHTHDAIIYQGAAERRLMRMSTDSGMMTGESREFTARHLQIVDVAGEEAVLAIRETGNPTLYYTNATLEGTVVHLPAAWPELEPSFGNDYGSGLLFARSFQKNAVNVAVGNRTVYRLDWQTGSAEKLYAAERPIYGLASSPDGSMAAVLVASDDFIGADADLVLLDGSGEVIDRWERAASYGHSDGFVIPYPISWELDGVLVPSEQASSGYAAIDPHSGQSQEWQPPAHTTELSEGERQLLAAELGDGPFEVMQLMRSSAKGKAAVQLNRNTTFVQEVWLLDESRGVLWLGPGLLLGFPDEETVLIAEPQSAGYVPFEVLN